MPSGGYEKERNLTPGKVLALYLNNYNQLLISYTDKIIQIDGKEKTVSSTMILQKAGTDYLYGAFLQFLYSSYGVQFHQ